MLWVPLRLAAAYACAYPFDRKGSTDPAGGVPDATAILAVSQSTKNFLIRSAQCTYAATSRFGANAACAYSTNLGAFWVGFAERCAACDSTAVDDSVTGDSYFPAQCTNDADPGANAYAIDYAPAVTNRTRLAMQLDMPVMAETADFLDILCRDQCSLHLACTDYLATNTRTCLLLGDLTPGHMDPKTTTTTATTPAQSTTTPSTTATTTSDICRHDACANDYNQCRYVDANGQVQCSQGSWQYDCELREGFEVFYCASTLLDDGSYVHVPVLVTPSPPGTTTPPFLQDFEATSVAAGTLVQHREIKRKATAYSAPFLRWAAMTPAQFRALSALEVEGEMTVLACATACESEPACASAVWGGTNEGCKYWAPPTGGPGDIQFDSFYWGDPPGEPEADAESVVPVVFSTQQSEATPGFWYDPFVEEPACSAPPCPSLCQSTTETHIRVVGTPPAGAADDPAVYTVNIRNCAHLQELQWFPKARLTPESLTNCTALRKVDFFDTVEPGGGPSPLTSCAVAPSFMLETTETPPSLTIKPLLGGTLTAFPTAQQWNTVAPEPDPNPETADLSNNLIRRIRDAALDDYPLGGLKHVDASHNLITTVGERAFTGVAASLETVDLSHNWITFVADTAFQDCTLLTTLNLNTNRITSLSYSIFSFVTENFGRLDTRNNYATGLGLNGDDMDFLIFLLGVPDTFDDDKLCPEAGCIPCEDPSLLICGDDPGALYPTAIPERFLGLEADTAQLPVPDGDGTTVWCIPCDGDKLAALNPDGRASLGGAITGVTRLFWTECPQITRATTANVGYDLAFNADGAVVRPERTALLAPAAPQLEQFSTAMDLRDRAFVLGYTAGTSFSATAGSTVLLTRCDNRVLTVMGDQPSRTTAFLGCLSRELYVEAATTVGALTFARMANLRRVSLPQSLVAIDPTAFQGSNRIIDLLVPAGTTADITTFGPGGCKTTNERKQYQDEGQEYLALAPTGPPCSRGFTFTDSRDWSTYEHPNNAPANLQCADWESIREYHDAGHPDWRVLGKDPDASFCNMAYANYECCKVDSCYQRISQPMCDDLSVGETTTDDDGVVWKRCDPVTTGPPNQVCVGPLCGGTRGDTELYGICGCARDAPGCFPSPGQQTALQVADATSPACGPEPVPAMGPLYSAPGEVLFYQPGMVPVQVTAKDETTPITMLAPIGRLHELCTGAGAQGLAVLKPPPPPPPALPARVDTGSGAPQLPLEMSRAAETPDGLPAYAVALVAIGSVGVVLGAAKLLRLV